MDNRKEVIDNVMYQLDYIGVERQRIESFFYWVFDQGKKEALGGKVELEDIFKKKSLAKKEVKNGS